MPKLTKRRFNTLAASTIHLSQAEAQDTAVTDREPEAPTADSHNQALAPSQQGPVLATHRHTAASSQLQQLNLESISVLPEQSQADHGSDAQNDPIEDSIDHHARPLLAHSRKSRKVCVHQAMLMLQHQHIHQVAYHLADFPHSPEQR